MNIEYYHASRFGNGAKVAEEFRRQAALLGATVNVSGSVGDWKAIDFNGKLGFIHKSLLTP